MSENTVLAAVPVQQAQHDKLPLVVDNVSKTLGDTRLFTNVNLELKAGESLAVLGESGSGKSTLLHLIAGLDVPDEGEVFWSGHSLKGRSMNALAAARLKHIGLVFQAYYLMPHLTAMQNVQLPFLLAGRTPNDDHCTALLSMVSLGDKTHRYPSELSGGEQQRVAIARALALNPPLILADEPTGSLDEENSKKVMTVLVDSCLSRGASLVVVTHSERTSKYMDQRLHLVKHRLATSKRG
jgi:ABC-type lipoprotein export system ATPase subunit